MNMRAILIYNVADLRYQLTLHVDQLLRSLYSSYPMRPFDAFGNTVPMIVDYWFRKRLEDMCLLIIQRPPYHVPPEVIQGLNRFPGRLDTQLYKQVKVPRDFADHTVELEFTQFDLYLIYN